MDTLQPYSHYLPVEPDAIAWGLHVLNSGFSEIGANMPYPPRQHPGKYDLSWSNGRVLDEYQLVYITRGRGIFESSETRKMRISAGQVFLLFPGVWHRYHPTKKDGWDESWIGFHGDIAERLMDGFFSPNKAVVPIGYDQELLQLIRSVAGLMRRSMPGYQQIIAARTMEALARVRSHSINHHAGGREISQKVHEARQYLLKHSAETIDMEGLAKTLGLSYSRFRAVFKEHTGKAPNQYQIDIRMNKARELLRHTKLPVSGIAEHTGISCVYYFSRLFKNREGCSPSAYRERYNRLTQTKT
ncbi:MAG: AraC family transcriptional regulator [Akkermansiaceae bacterium]|nr:AraC family transcriptional regulator [Akkermansiaceae bacterium]